jgi:glycerophosphoryl diester phosphodiesterase
MMNITSTEIKYSVHKVATALRETLKHIKDNFSQYLIFEWLMAIISSSIVIPVMLRLYQWSLKSLGDPYVINPSLNIRAFDGIGFGVSILGIFVLSVLILIEYVMLIILVVEERKGQNLSLFSALITSVISMKRLILPGLLHIMNIALALLPALFILVRYLPINLSITIKDWINKNQENLYIYVALLLLWLIIHLYTLFMMYYMVVYQETSREALKKSIKLVKKDFFKMLRLWMPIFFSILAVIGASVIMMHWGVRGIESLKIYVSLKNIALYTVTIVVYSLILMTFPIYVTYLVISFEKLEATTEVPKLKIISLKNDFNFRKSKLIKGSLLLLLIVIMIVNYRVIEGVVRWDVAIAAHRGYSSMMPENTIESIQAAIDHQAEYVEIDVMLTADEVVVLHHEDSLLRMAGVDVHISKTPYLKLLDYPISGYDSESLIDILIPTLEDALLLCQGQIKVIIDIKESGQGDRIVEETLKVVQALEMNDTVMIQSFNTRVLSTVRKLEPEMKIGQILFFASGNLGALDVDFYTIRKNMLTTQFVSEAHKINRKVWVWTVNSNFDLREVLRYDIDGIITDYPTRAQTMRNLVRKF